MVVSKPRALKRGDTVRFVTPASPIKPDHLVRISEVLEGEGYKIEVGRHAMNRSGYLAGSDQERATDIMEAFEAPHVRAVFCSRGGYGCARLMPLLDLDMMAESRKMFLGFSDITTVHAALNQRGLATVHSPMGITLSSPREDWVVESLLNVLRGENPIVPTAPVAETIVPGTSEGLTSGGCLCLITDSLGTANEVPFDGRILFIEDVDEWPHRVDAMLTHLILTGRLQKCAGIVVGEMTRTDERMEETIGALPWREIVSERLKPLGIPCVMNYPFGHAPQMLSLPLGVRARLDAEAGTIEYLESHCED